MHRHLASATSASVTRATPATLPQAAGFLTQKPGICLTVSALASSTGSSRWPTPPPTASRWSRSPVPASGNRVDLQRGDYEEMDQLPPPGCSPRRPTGVARPRTSAAVSPARSAPRIRPSRGVYLDIPAAVLGEVLDAERAAGTVWRVVNPAPKQLPEIEAVRRGHRVLAAVSDH